MCFLRAHNIHHQAHTKQKQQTAASQLFVPDGHTVQSVNKKTTFPSKYTATTNTFILLLLLLTGCFIVKFQMAHRGTHTKMLPPPHPLKITPTPTYKKKSWKTCIAGKFNVTAAKILYTSPPPQLRNPTDLFIKRKHYYNSSSSSSIIHRVEICKKKKRAVRQNARSRFSPRTTPETLSFTLSRSFPTKEKKHKAS